MKFRFYINLTDEDYFDYNLFWSTRSHYGKKQMKSIQVLLVIVVALFAVLRGVIDGFTFAFLLSLIPLAILAVLFLALFQYLFKMFLKSSLKGMRKRGKMAYSPHSVIEFYEERLIETTPDQKMEVKYTVIERVSIVKDKTVYIHVNNITSYILPMTCFESQEQYSDFLSFLQTKCNNIDVFEQ